MAHFESSAIPIIMAKQRPEVELGVLGRPLVETQAISVSGR